MIRSSQNCRHTLNNLCYDLKVHDTKGSLVNEKISGRAIHRTLARVIAFCTDKITRANPFGHVWGRARAIARARMTRLKGGIKKVCSPRGGGGGGSTKTEQNQTGGTLCTFTFQKIVHKWPILFMGAIFSPLLHFFSSSL